MSLSRYFTGVVYGDQSTIDRILDNDEIKHFCYINHNNDHWLKDDDLPEGVSVGDLKKPHWHLMVYTASERSPSSVYKFFNSDGQVCPSVEIVKSPSGSKKYQRHIDEDSIKKGKHQYEADEQISDDISFWDRENGKPGKPEKKSRDEWWQAFVDLIFTQGYCKRSDLRDFGLKYGRDFGINYFKALQFVADCLGCSANEMFCTPTERAAHNAKLNRVEYETNILERYRDYAVNSISDQVQQTILDRFTDDFKKQFYKGV